HIAYAYICANYFGNPAKKLKLIAVTGTNGKTTITYILKHIIEETGRKCGLIGTIHNEIDDIAIPAKNTTPDAYQLHSMLSRMVQAGCEYAVMEASSHALDQHRLAGCRFDAAIFTNLTQDHLDYHENLESYFKAKRKLFDMCGCAVLNIDDEYGVRIYNEVDCRKVSFSIEKDDADYTAKSIAIASDGSKFALVGNSVIARISYCMPGRFAVSNAMGAAACMLALGFDFNTVANALNTCKGVTGRCEVIKTDKNFTVIRDYAHSPDGLEKIISTLKEFAPSRVITLFGCAGNRDRTKRPKMGEIASRLSDFVILTSDNPRDEDPQQIVEDVLPGLLKHNTPYKVIVDRYEAIKWGLENARKDDILLLAGKGHEDYQVLAGGTIYFDEKEIVQRLAGKGENTQSV
ncbi:MAG TPA: UDP-N-acetylmuramoyl-L-alanyl-D-glutamate--2,6-diaminopimelate ligase, partial [Ruminococcaceae bacterium]|nr:UDP-N-acetylmuramoyl-L-alanyl-D-glutamate--2,6-diaminopimelate ligase [Oscillospiraceae bacterium]